MSRFVRQSSYRHVYGQPAKKEKLYDNIKISASAWDTNLVSASAKYLAVNYQSSGGGAFLVTPLESTGKLPDLFPLCRAHTAPVLDTAWSPFDDSIVASAGEDGRVAITRVDEQTLLDAWNGDVEAKDLEPVARFSAHGRKAGHVLWHPTADGVLASASTEVKVWDVQSQQSKHTSDVHSDMVQSLAWDYTGGVYATTCKDKKLRLFDPRAGSAAVTVADSHSGVKGSRVEWMGSLDRLVTTGFSRTSDRQLYLWDSRSLTSGPIKSMNIDQSSGMLMPFWNAGNNVLFLAGKGDGNIRYYEYENDALHYLTEYSSNQPQRGMCFLPPRARDIDGNEIGRAFKAHGSTVEPISFIVPRKSDAFQSDIFPPCPSDKPSLAADDWFGGKTAEPILLSLETRQATGSATTVQPKSYASSSSAAPSPAKPEAQRAATPPAAAASVPASPAPPKAQAKAASPAAVTPVRQASPPPPPPAASARAEATPSPATNGASSASQLNGEAESLRQENEKLRGEVAERDTIIRELELKLERIKAAFN